MLNHMDWVFSVVFSSDSKTDGRFLVSSSADKTVKVWNLQTDETLYTFEHPDWIRSVAVDPDGRLLASRG